jgi:antitoxin Phd
MIWALQDAKNKFSELVDKAMADGPQTVTKHGRETVVVLSIHEYHKMRLEQQNVVDFLMNSPLSGVTLPMTRAHDDAPRAVHL